MRASTGQTPDRERRLGRTSRGFVASVTCLLAVFGCAPGGAPTSREITPAPAAALG